MPQNMICWYCFQKAEYVDSSEVHRGVSYGMIYYCRPCEAWVGVHPGTDKPLGRLANKELRQAKMAAHRAFDPLWERKIEITKCDKKYARRLGYKWLAGELDIPVEQCHIGHFDIETCEKVVEACKPGSRNEY